MIPENFTKHENTYLEALRAGSSRNDPTGSNWQDRHRRAISPVASIPRPSHEHGMAAMIAGFAEYADAYRAAYGSPIGEDYVLGPEWARIGRALLGLLNGDLGRMDGGTLDGFLRDSLAAEDFGTESED